MSLKNLRNGFNYLILLSALSILPGCTDWFKEKFGGSCEKSACSSCHGPETKSLTGEALLSIDGNVVITVQDFEDFWKTYTEGNPQAALIASLYPNLRREVFNNLMVPFELAKTYVKKTGKESTPEFQKTLARQMDLVCKHVAFETFQKDALNKVDKSSKALGDFYNENKEKIRAFQEAPFIKTPGGTSAISIEFDNDKEAADFLERTKAEGSDFAKLAQEVGKQIKDHGLVAMDNQEVNYFVKTKLNELQPDQVAKVDLGKDKFVVIKAISKQKPVYASFDEVIRDPRAKDIIERELTQVKGVEMIKQEMENLKKAYSVQENNSFFDKEEESKQAELSKMQKDLEVLNEDVEELEAGTTEETPEA